VAVEREVGQSAQRKRAPQQRVFDGLSLVRSVVNQDIGEDRDLWQRL